MKRAIYLTKTKVSFSGKSFDWSGNDLIKIFKGIRSDERIKDVRIVLGNDISFVTSFKEIEKQTREKVEIQTRNAMPFVLEENCFDYKVVAGVGGESWVQAVAIEKWLLDAVSLAVWESGLSLELMIPIGVLLGEKSAGRETPIIVRWNGYENLSVLAVNGLTDSVHADETDEQLNAYAKGKWNLAVDLEQLILDDKIFNMDKEAFGEKSRGEDATVLNIPVLKKQEIAVEGVKPEVPGAPSIEVLPPEKKTPKISVLVVSLIVILIASIGILVFVLFGSKITGTKKPEVVTPAVTVTTAPTPTPTAVVEQKVDLSGFVVQVLNGSGVTGEAGRVKDLLISRGFVTVDTGNAPATTSTLISRKTTLPEQAVDIAKENVTKYKLGNIGILTSGDKYDLVIVLGSEKN